MIPYLCVPVLLFISAPSAPVEDRRDDSATHTTERPSAAQSNMGLAVGPDVPPDVASRSAEPDFAPPASSEAALMRLRRPTSGQSSPTSQEAHTKLRLSSNSAEWMSSGIMATAAVLGLIGVVFWMFRRAMPAGRWRDSVALSVMTRVAMGPKQSIALVRVGRRRVLVVGMSADRVSSLADITADEEVAELTAMQASSRSWRGSFEADLREAVRAGNVENDAPPVDDEPARASLGRARSRLEALIQSLHPGATSAPAVETTGVP